MDPKKEAELFTRRKHSSSSSGSCEEHIVLQRSPKTKDSSSPPTDHQSFSFISSPEDSDDRQSPPGYDPNRIPSSIFSSKPANPTEWSVASNESLFSIQMGNNSFTKEQYAFMLYKSGELTKADELCNVQGSQLPPVEEKEDVGTVGGEVKEDSLRLKADSGGGEVMEEHEVKRVAPAIEASNSSISPHSDGTGSNHSARSFAFPLLAPTGEDGRNCSARAVSKNHDAQKQSQSQEQATPKQQHLGEEQVKPKASCRRWLSCFYCCPSRCYSKS